MHANRLNNCRVKEVEGKAANSQRFDWVSEISIFLLQWSLAYFFCASNRPLTSKSLKMFAHFSVFRSPIAMKWYFKSIFLRLHWCYWQLIAHWNIIAINISNQILIQTITFIWNSFSECNVKTSKQLCSWYKNRCISITTKWYTRNNLSFAKSS